MPGWRSGYRASLENSFPQGFPGSNPGPGVDHFGINVGCKIQEVLDYLCKLISDNV